MSTIDLGGKTSRLDSRKSCDRAEPQILCAFNSSNYSGRHEQWHDKEFMRSPICGVGGSRGKGGKKGVADVGYKNCS
uniref:Uncharacterized protein n=1 Tax=Fagus sylvatica TaxID=28930 RepID=A0A2N9EK89_FAGSY